MRFQLDTVHLAAPLSLVELASIMYSTYITAQLFKAWTNAITGQTLSLKRKGRFFTFAHFSWQTPGEATPASPCFMQSWCKQAASFHNYSSNNSWLKWEGLGPGAPVDCLYKSQNKYRTSGEKWGKVFISCRAAGSPLNLTHLSFSLLPRDCSLMFVGREFADCRNMSVFSRSPPQLCLNQGMLWAADGNDDESVMWECHQSLGNVVSVWRKSSIHQQTDLTFIKSLVTWL